MFRRILFIILALSLISIAVRFTTFSKTALASLAGIDETTRKQILGATVYISLFAPLTDAQGNPEIVQVDGQKAIQLTVGEGLGTLAHQDGELVIVTHDHWPLLTADLRRVEFHNVEHELLLQLNGEQFIQLVRYRDGGTMVLTAPDKVVGHLTAVPLGRGNSAAIGDTVILAYRQPDGGEVGAAVMLVQKESAYKGQPVYRLVSLNGEVVSEGNSGGGVIFGGQLIGNMWGTILTEEVSIMTGRGTGSPQQTSFSVVSQLPAAISTQ